ncbi:MAG: rod shape-determining protein MreD [Methylophilaceae bacterium]|uniref:rod shape-determining protein MreD n=1 Tax=Methylovorus sp. MM2 TaxID=1848038 RepID=UPI0007E062AB|nr:rod shape-determining protein MreD [Methylovorus sp. MM2]OAM52151.1 rod shape-determining protein MreD [Methylovorus sp. MM2]
MQAAKLKSMYLSLFVAFICYLLPWSGVGLLIRPDFVLLVLLYWLLRSPRLCNIGTAWFAGLLIDLASGGLFGQCGLAYAVTAFFAVTYQRRLTLFNIWQQSGYIFILLILNQLTLWMLKLFAGGESPGWSYLLPCVSGILLWQFIMFSRIGIETHADKN